MQSIFAGAKLAGWTEGRNARIDHVGFGVVLGEDGYLLRRENYLIIKILFCLI